MLFGGGKVLNKKLVEIGSGRHALSDSQQFEREFLQHLPDVPALPETLLCMELEIHEQVVNLGEFTQLLMGDLGATLQVFRLAGNEYGSAGGRLNRIQDCISDLGLQACLDVASKRTVIRDARKGAIIDAWIHARSIAKHCALWAEATSGTMNPEEAYLVGLFHELGQLPALLGWAQNGPSLADQACVGLWMAEEWALPRCVREYFCEGQTSGSIHPWSVIVDVAHQLDSMSDLESAVRNRLRQPSYSVA
ncbi:MAG TPA: HDOD domain-containing protein [Terracidiphilus sp.]|nr:HDOD domain-containing protein [Terracidiphilus sp.]